MNQRLISFGQSTIGLEYGNGRPALIANFLFQKIPASNNEQPWTMLRLEDHGEDQGLWLWQDDTLLFKDNSIESTAGGLMSQVCFTLAYESKGGLLLHSAAVKSIDKGIIMPGKSGAGKSTLTAWLIHHGSRYLSDEMVYIASASSSVSGFTRPITIKSPARHLLPQLLIEDRASNGILHSESIDMIAPEQFGAQVVKDLPSLDLIIFPRFETDQTVQMERLSKAQTAYELMKCLANARNMDDHGFSEAVRIAKSTPAYSLSYGDTEQAGRSIMRRFLS
jgi:hypothetical protein